MSLFGSNRAARAVVCLAVIGIAGVVWSTLESMRLAPSSWETRDDVVMAQPKTSVSGLRGYNGFRVDNSIISLDKIMRGGPPRDGIPAILEPKFVDANTDQGFSDKDTVIVFSHNGDTRAYLLNIIVMHEIVNDTVGGKPVAVTYCPLCGTSMVFDRVYGDTTFSFGVSGLLYNSDVLMYDHQTDSLWSQLMMKSVAGDSVEEVLTWLPSTEMTLGAFRAKYPEGRVLSMDTGHRRNYRLKAYAAYFRSPDTMFPVEVLRNELALKDWVIGVKIGDSAKAYPIALFDSTKSGVVTDELGNTSLQITVGGGGEGISVENAVSGERIPHVKLYWFAWQAFYPTTSLFVPKR